jgi:hypothetical protein
MTSTCFVSPRSNTLDITPSVYKAHISKTTSQDSNSYANELVERSRRIYITFVSPVSMFHTPGQIVAIRSTEPSIMETPHWVSTTNELCKKGSVDSALKEISLATTRIKQTGDIERLEKEIEYLNLHSLPSVVLIALLRNTFSIKSRISRWERMLTHIETILNSRNQNARSLLRGLKQFT